MFRSLACAWADHIPDQVDTGYGDLPQGVVQVNAALMRIFRDTAMAMHSLPSDVVTVGCSGTYTYERWQIEHDEFSIVTLADMPLRVTLRHCLR